MAQNNDYTSYLAGKVYVAALPAWIPTYTVWSNEVAIETYLESNAIFTRLFWVQGLEIVQDYSAQVASIRWDECDYQETKYSKPQININFDWLENLDLAWLAIATWNAKINVASSPVAVTAEAKGTGWTVWTPIRLNNKNGVNTIVSAIVVKAWGSALTITTNYVTYVWNWTNGDLWYTYIVPVTTNALVITVDYSYTPNASEYSWVKMSTSQLPQLVVKIVWCPDASALYNTHYLVNGSLTWTVTRWFVDLAVAWNPVASPISFASNSWGYLVDKIQRI